MGSDLGDFEGTLRRDGLGTRANRSATRRGVPAGGAIRDERAAPITLAHPCRSLRTTSGEGFEAEVGVRSATISKRTWA
eukprot:5740437-Pyramimonas_sp.AAC.1